MRGKPVWGQGDIVVVALPGVCVDGRIGTVLSAKYRTLNTQRQKTEQDWIYEVALDDDFSVENDPLEKLWLTAKELEP